MNSLTRARRRSAAALLLAVLAFLVAGSLLAQRRFLLRGVTTTPPLPVSYAGVTLGVNVELAPLAPAARRSQLADIAGSGIGIIRHSFYFQPGYDWSISDDIVAAAAESGLTLVGLLDGNPADGFAPPADPLAYARWAGDFAARYAADLRYYMIWDEPNIAGHWGGQPANPYTYAALLAAAAAEIRLADGDAVIITAPLAPTVETGPKNLSDAIFLQQLYDLGAAPFFDIVSAKPYGFDSGPADRVVDPQRLNFSRVILLREVMLRNGDGEQAIWAGNWGWNSLPVEWAGSPSIWGNTDQATRTAWTIGALERARQEWTWMGVMFLEAWQPLADGSDPRRGFQVAGTPLAPALAAWTGNDDAVAYPGFHQAAAGGAGQSYSGGWRFSPAYGADISASGDSATLAFWGTDIALQVRRADFRGRLHVTVDGQPANALPRDETGASLILTAADPGAGGLEAPLDSRELTLDLVARNLDPGRHTLTLVADRGWDQWALAGYAIAAAPPPGPLEYGLLTALIVAMAALAAGIRSGRRAAWGAWLRASSGWFARLDDGRQAALAALLALLAALGGWLTWGQQAAGLYRRLGDSTQLAAAAAAATLFYVSPAFFAYAAALGILFLLLLFRPLWGLALIAFSLPFYILPRPMLSYRFSPVEVFTLLTAAAALLSLLLLRRDPARRRPDRTDWAVAALVVVATLSLFTTERLDVASNEWRVVVVEGALFYATWRIVRPTRREAAWVADAFVAGGVLVALIGLGQYAAGLNLITAEGGLSRLRSIYGSPNNVALYFDRVLPLTLAVALLGAGWRRRLYGAALLPLGLAFLLTFSKGGLLLGLPAGGATVFYFWQRARGRRPWPWLLAGALLGASALLAALQVPALAARLNLGGDTSFLRLNLWRASLPMIADHPLLGVGLDNFLYAYRGRYILQEAWREPNLNHPHNILLDFATRLGVLGLLAGTWLFVRLGRHIQQALRGHTAESFPLAVGLAGALAASLAHGLVDHSFFLVDLAFAFFLLLGLARTLSADESAAAP